MGQTSLTFPVSDGNNNRNDVTVPTVRSDPDELFFLHDFFSFKTRERTQNVQINERIESRHGTFTQKPV